MEDQSSLNAIEIPEEILERVKPELAPGERLLWAAKGTERGGGPIEFASPLVWAGSLWLACGILIAGAFILLKPLPEIVWVLGLGGGILGFAAFLVTTGTLASWASNGFGGRKPAECFYALTDRRAIIWQPSNEVRNAVNVQSVHRGALVAVNRNEYPDGFGDVRFVKSSDHAAHPPWGFTGVPNVRLVEIMVSRTLIVPEAGTAPSNEH